YKTNLELVEKLISSLERTKSKAHIIMSSSTQEERDNPYGKSKKEGRKLFIQWAKAANATFTGMVIPNIFGPGGKPYYNSVVATFAFQIIKKENPKILLDSTVKLIYIDELVSIILN